MCGRFTHRLTWAQLVALYRLTNAAPPFQFSARYNVAPSQWVPIIRWRGGKREAAILRWGLVPSWAKDPAIGYRTINARAETVATAPIHNRMPVILDPADFEAWLTPGESPIAQALLRPYPADRLKATPISPRVNSPKNDDPAVIEPVAQ